MCLLKATYSQILVYIATITKGKRNKSGAKININITAIIEPKIKPNHNIKAVTKKIVTSKFHKARNGSNTIFFKSKSSSSTTV